MPVVLAVLVASGVLGAALIWVIDQVLLDTTDRARFRRRRLPRSHASSSSVSSPRCVALAVGLLGPLWLAARPRFDDMIDGLTFGVVSGAAYAAGETLVMHRDVLGAGRLAGRRRCCGCRSSPTRRSSSRWSTAPPWRSPPPSFSGIGAGYEGSAGDSPRALAIAAFGMVAYGAGVAVLGRGVDGAAGAALGLAVGRRRRRGADRDPAHAAPSRGARGGAGSRSRPTQPPRGAQAGPAAASARCAGPAAAVLQRVRHVGAGDVEGPPATTTSAAPRRREPGHDRRSEHSDHAGAARGLATSAGQPGQPGRVIAMSVAALMALGIAGRRRPPRCSATTTVIQPAPDSARP